MDGVLCDFHNHFIKWFDKTVKVQFKEGDWHTVAQFCEATNITEEFFWLALDSYFWHTIPWTEDGKAILTACEETFGRENVCILSSPANEESAHGKTRWLKLHLPHYLRDGRVYLGRDKRFVACPLAVLVDDADKNINGFREFGGVGILVPRLWNSAFDLQKDGLNLVKAAILKSRSIVCGRENILKKVLT